ncbi:MAG: hypothetical protein WAN74_00390 [Thermoplasmata archaeon]
MVTGASKQKLGAAVFGNNLDELDALKAALDRALQKGKPISLLRGITYRGMVQSWQKLHPAVFAPRLSSPP